MRKLASLLSVLAVFFLVACNSPRLEPGGAYAPTNSVGQASAAPDLVFYQVDSAFDLAFAVVQGAFKFEYDNRQFLWGLSPKIKHTLDDIRPQTVKAVQEYFVAREAYMANPTPPGLTTLQAILANMQRLADTARAVTADLQKGN